MRKIIAFMLLCLCSTAAFAQSVTKKDTINTDRPDQSESPNAVPKGALQIEAGAVYTMFDSSGLKSVIGMPLIRYGISKRVEARFLVEDGTKRDLFVEETTQGTYPLAVSTKIVLQDKEGKIFPEAALVAYLKLPFTSRSEEQKAYWSPAFVAAFENKIGKQITLGYNVGFKQSAYASDWQWMSSVTLHYKLGWRTEIFAEYAGQYANGEDPVHGFDAGLQYHITPLVQIDAAFGRSFSAPFESSNSFGTAGISWLLPRY